MTLHVTVMGNMHKIIREVTGKKICSSIGCLKSKNEMLILEEGKIPER